MLRRTTYLLLAAVLGSMSLHAQDDFRSRFEEFTRSASRSHSAFTDSANLSFARALQQQWERISVDEGLERVPSPAPEAVPEDSEGKRISSDELPVYETVGPEPEFWDSAWNTGAGLRGQSQDTKSVSFTLYGVEMSASVPAAYGTFHPESISEDGVAAFWRELSSCDYSPILEECGRNREQYGFNDWAVLEWTEALAAALYPDDICSERTIFTVFIMNQLGLMAKIARSSGDLLCLFSSRQQIYARKYVVVDTYPYYLTDARAPVRELFTYRMQLGRPSRPLDLRLRRPLKMGGETEVASRSSKVFGRTFSLPLDRAALSFYEGYPQVDPVVQATARPGRAFSDALVSQIEDAVKGTESRKDALGMMLRFLQEDFGYMQDVEQFGCERPFFCEENFRYESNDCEDRAALLVFLAREVLGLRSVLLDYPGHMAAAVELPEEVRGDYVTHGGSRFHVCDPSYVGAGIGRSMPEYRRSPAKVWVAY